MNTVIDEKGGALPHVHSIAAVAADTLAGGRCRLCISPFIAYVRHIPMRRVRLSNPIYFCMECESFQLPQTYREPDDQLSRDAEWHVAVEDRNRTWADNFFDAVLHRDPSISSVVEIGCGTGTLLAAGRDRGLRVRGHDTNPYVAPLAWQRHQLEIDSSLWTSDSSDESFDLVVCISILEHLPDPRSLVAEFAEYGRRTGAVIFVSVPFATERDAWSHLLEPAPSPPNNPLYLSDVHINHFSHRGFQRLMADFGATNIEFFPRGWIGYLVRF